MGVVLRMCLFLDVFFVGRVNDQERCLFPPLGFTENLLRGLASSWAPPSGWSMSLGVNPEPNETNRHCCIEVVWLDIHMSNEKKCIGDEILHSYMGNYNKWLWGSLLNNQPGFNGKYEGFFHCSYTHEIVGTWWVVVRFAKGKLDVYQETPS